MLMRKPEVCCVVNESTGHVCTNKDSLHLSEFHLVINRLAMNSTIKTPPCCNNGCRMCHLWCLLGLHSYST